MAEERKNIVVSGQVGRRFGMPSPKGLFVLILAVFLISAGAIGAWYLFIRENEPPQESVKPCSTVGSDMFNKALEVYDPYDSEGVASKGPIVEEILKTKDYEQDANCLYPVTMYYVTVGDIENAKKYHEELKKVYLKPDDVSWYFPYRITNEEIADHIAYQERVRDESVNQDLFFEIPKELEGETSE